MTGSVAQLLFSDVDETIIRQKSLFALLQFGDLLEPRLDARELSALTAVLTALKSGEVSRERANALYYEHVLTGRSVVAMERVARAWFARGMAEPSAFIDPEVAAFLSWHRARGTPLIFVTGSFSELLSPLAAHLGASAVLGAPLEVVAGRYTGRLLGAPCIGGGKASAVQRYALARGVDLSQCVAIGDDVTDLDFLRCVGSAVLPERADPQLQKWAKTLGWPTVSEARHGR